MRATRNRAPGGGPSPRIEVRAPYLESPYIRGGTDDRSSRGARARWHGPCFDAPSLPTVRKKRTSPGVALEAWVNAISRHTEPETIHWWSGSTADRDLASERVTKMRQEGPTHIDLERPQILVSTHRRIDAGPTNLWVSREDAQSRLWPLLRGCMRGRAMYVVPYLLGPPSSRFCRVGVQITDSPHVALDIDAKTRAGKVALDHPASSAAFARGLHCREAVRGAQRLLVHFPELVETWSIGSDSLREAQLCVGIEGLRLASARAREEGWLAERMSLFSLTRAKGSTRFLAAAAADSGGMAELEAELRSSADARLSRIGGESSWMRVGDDGRLWAVSPEEKTGESPVGVPVDAVVWCGRQTRSTPLIYEAQSWRHGVYMGATLMREAEGASWPTYDPMSMLAVCGYNMGDYFSHWLSIGRKLVYPPKFFHINWFRVDAEGRRLWPGGAENIRILKWMGERMDGTGGAVPSPLGRTPDVAELDLRGLDMSHERLLQALSCDQAALLAQAESARQFLFKFGDCLPATLLNEHRQLVRRLQESVH